MVMNITYCFFAFIFWFHLSLQKKKNFYFGLFTEDALLVLNIASEFIHHTLLLSTPSMVSGLF